MQNINQIINEKEEICGKAFIAWTIAEQNHRDMSQHDEEIADMFISKMLFKKFEVFDIDIVLPDELLFILAVCTDGNPGQSQIILKDLLLDIKKRKGPIRKGYVITPIDFSMCFTTRFPIIDIPEMNDKYMKLWDGQKKERDGSMDSNNLCDTVKWWKEVMEC